MPKSKDLLRQWKPFEETIINTGIHFQDPEMPFSISNNFLNSVIHLMNRIGIGAIMPIVINASPI